MPNLKDIRRRIRSVKNTQQITKAMKMVSAARLRRAQERVVAARPYAATMTRVLENLSARAEGYSDPLLEERGDERYLVVLVTSDKGLCGAFNTNLIKAAQAFIRDNPEKQVSMLPVGRRGRDFFRRQHRNWRGAQMRVQRIAHAARRKRLGDIDVRDLADAVNARVRSPCADDICFLARKGENCALQRALHRWAFFLALPTFERAAVIFYGELEAGHQRSVVPAGGWPAQCAAGPVAPAPVVPDHGMIGDLAPLRPWARPSATCPSLTAARPPET